jgi:ankyrin repeat protein
MCATRAAMEWRKNNPERYHEIDIRSKRARGINAMDKNRECSMFLGIHVAEEVLCRLFEDVERMPTNNPGYDFVCSNGYLIDSKSACILKNDGIPKWHFHINKNTIADYFILLAFDNRESLTPLHIWMIPGSVVNHLTSIAISESVIHKWDEYRLDIDKVVMCCDTMKEANHE